MRADRLLSILLLLQANGRMSGRDLATRLEVAERTVHRDMEALSMAGIPVFAIRGSQGGWQLDEEWRAQVPGLNELELQGLLMSQSSGLGDRKLAIAAEQAVNKLLSALPIALRARAVSFRQRMFVDPSGWRGASDAPLQLPVVQEAVLNDRKLEFTYRGNKGGSARRSVDPLGLVTKDSIWYLVANTARGYRTFRISRMYDAVTIDSPCERPPRFDLEAHWKTSTAQLLEKWGRYEAVLRMDRKAAQLIPFWAAASRVGDADADGWVTAEVEFDDEEHACFVACGLASRCDVVAPLSLRALVASKLVEAVKRTQTEDS